MWAVVSLAMASLAMAVAMGENDGNLSIWNRSNSNLIPYLPVEYKTMPERFNSFELHRHVLKISTNHTKVFFVSFSKKMEDGHSRFPIQIQRILGDEIASIESFPNGTLVINVLPCSEGYCHYCHYVFWLAVAVTVVVIVQNLWYWFKKKTPTREDPTTVSGIEVFEEPKTVAGIEVFEEPMTVDGIKVFEDKLIGIGREGTLIFEGEFGVSEVAVKRIQRHIYSIEKDEIEDMKSFEGHANIMRYFMTGTTRDFHYIAFEKCSCNLREFILAFSSKVQNSDTEKRIKLQEKIGCNDFLLSKQNQYPSPAVLDLIRGLIAGIRHIHATRKLQRDLTPENIMLIRLDTTFHVKLNDMRLTELHQGASSHHPTASVGWSAPEVLTKASPTHSADLFTLGCIIFYFVSEGQHPFGADELRVNERIVGNIKDLSCVKNVPEAFDIIESLIDPNPAQGRAMMKCSHILFSGLLLQGLGSYEKLASELKKKCCCY